MNRYIQKKKNYTLNLNKKNASIKKSRFEDDVVGDIFTVSSTTTANTLRSRGKLILNDYSVFDVSTNPIYGIIKEVEIVTETETDADRTEGVYSLVPQDSTNGNGIEATFDVNVLENGTAVVTAVVNKGKYYKVDDIITISAQEIGTTGVDLQIKVISITPRDYTFTDETESGGSGTGGVFEVQVSKTGNILIKATTEGSNYQYDDELTVLNHIVFKVKKTTFTSSYTNVATTGGNGTGATLDVTINQDGTVSAAPNNKGTGYLAGNILTVADVNVGNTGAPALTFSVHSLDFKDLEFVWNLPSMNLSKNAKLYVSNVSNLNAVSTYLYTISCKEVNGSQTWNSDNGYPLIYCEKGFVSPNNVNIEHSLSNPESMNTLTLYINDDVYNNIKGINSDIDFMITIVISDYDEEKVDGNIMRMVKPEHYTDKKFPL